MKQLAFYLLIAVAFTCQAGDAQSVTNDGSFFFIQGEALPRNSIEAQTFGFEEYLATQIRISRTGDTTFVPRIVSIALAESEAFEDYLCANGFVYIIAPQVDIYDGKFVRSPTGRYLVMSYGKKLLPDSLLESRQKGERTFGYVTLEHTVLYPMTARLWKNVFGGSYPRDIFQTAVVVVTKSSTQLSYKTQLVSFERESDAYPLTLGRPMKVTYQIMYLARFDNEPATASSPYVGAFKKRESKSARIVMPTDMLPVTFPVVSVLPEKKIEQPKDIVVIVPPSVSPDRHPKITAHDGVVTVSWLPVPEATEYMIRLYYEDGQYNTKYLMSSPAVFKNVASGERCRVVVTVKKNDEVIASEEFFFTME